MIIDRILELADAADISGASALLTHSLDLEEYGLTDKVVTGWMNIQVNNDVDFTGLDSGVRFNLITSDTSALNSGNAEKVSSGIILPALLVAGARFSFGFWAKMHKHLGVYRESVSETATGTLNIGCQLSYSPWPDRYVQKNLSYS